MKKRSLCLITLLCLLFSIGGMASAPDPNLTEPGTLPIAKEPITLTVARQQDILVLDYETNYQTKWVEEKTGINLEWQIFPSTDAVQKMNIMVASGAKLPDIISVGTASEMRIFGANGALVPLEDYMHLATNFQARCAELGLDPEWVINMCKHSDGHLYGMPRLNANPPDTIAWRTWINTAWLEAVGMDFPTTSDELLAVLRAFRDEDPNGNGVKDEIPLVGSTNAWNGRVFSRILNMFTYYDGSATSASADENYYLLSDGVLDVSYDKDEYREALRFARMLYDEGLLSSLSFTQDSSQYNALCSQDPPVVGIGVSGSASPFAANRPSYEGLPAIKGPNGAQYATGSVSLPIITSGISVDCENFEAALRLLDAFYMDEEYMRIDRWGEPEVDWTYPDEDELSPYEGVKPGVKVLKDIWGLEQNSTWRNGFIPVLAPSDGSLYSPVWNGDVNVGESKNARAIAKLRDYIPAERVAAINYTDEESQLWAETRAVIKTYVQESQARFITGAMDIETEWDGYLAELSAMNYKGLLDADQAAFNRTLGK